MEGLIGKKLGMTQVFDSEGHRVAVTVLEAGPCVVIQRKTTEKDGYDAVQLGFGDQKESRMSKPAMGRFKAAGTAPKVVLREFPVNGEEELKAGDTLTVQDVFDGTTFVDVLGVTKGRGFAGAIKRHNFARGRMTHGSHNKRRPGAIGQCAYPGRVAKGKKMPGQMGGVNVLEENLKVVELKGEENLLLVKGAVPGATGSIVYIKKSLKKRG
ncbi:50S ribosomal protein L3 [bacterium E08(2017)]|nr:50S ribosomal protein L3 [bacterium E08(2017)]